MPEAARVLAAVAGYVRDITGQPGLAVPADARLADLDGMDSLKWIETIAVLEERLGVVIDTAALDRIETVGDVVTLLARGAAAR